MSMVVRLPRISVAAKELLVFFVHPVRAFVTSLTSATKCCGCSMPKLHAVSAFVCTKLLNRKALARIKGMSK
jgi:hypothetical protein